MVQYFTFVIFADPLETAFWLFKLEMRSAPCFEFDMPALDPLDEALGGPWTPG